MNDVFVSIIVPTYNEVENIQILIHKINKILSNKHYRYEIIIVDDNSPDKTWQIAMKLREKYPLRVLLRKNQMGLSSAVLCGFKKAKGNVLGVLDADLSHPLQKIPELIDAIIKKNADMAIGSRFVQGGSIDEDWILLRKIISWFAKIFTIPLTNVNDTMSGFFFIKKEVINNVELKPRGYKICLEILIRGRCNKVIEVPIFFEQRRAGKSKLSFFVLCDYIIQLFSLYKYKFIDSKK